VVAGIGDVKVVGGFVDGEAGDFAEESWPSPEPEEPKEAVYSWWAARRGWRRRRIRRERRRGLGGR